LKFFHGLALIAILVAVLVASQTKTAYAHGCQAQLSGGMGASCFWWPNGTFWSYSDILNVAGALAMTSIIAIVGLKYHFHLKRNDLHVVK